MTDKTITAYLAAFDAEARRLKLAEWRDISSDVHGHIVEAVDHGRPLPDVLKAIGRPEALARAYALELLMQDGRPARGGWIGRALGLVTLVAVGGVVTLLLVVALGSIGLIFTLSGVIFLVAGLLEGVGLHLSFVHTGGAPPWVFIVLAPLLFAIGWGALWLLAKYVRFAARRVVQALPARLAA